MQAAPLQPGFMIVQSNQLEDLRNLAVQWMRRHPLAPLENETILVQSNGIAQWLKLALAQDAADDGTGGCGIAAALNIQLPARFLWNAYRAVLGSAAIAEASPLDRDPLTWRLMRLLPTLVDRPRFLPLQRFLDGDNDLRKRHQLALRLADLFDQYQVYRADWLHAWAEERDELITSRRGVVPVPEEQSWQPELWRAVLDDVGAGSLGTSRVGVHQRFMRQMPQLDALPRNLPRRVVVFGISSMPAQTLEALAAMAGQVQVLLCVHNPSQHHWGDIVADRDLLRHDYRRQSRRPDMPATLDEDALHAHGHPLLAAWGKQGRDYLNLLDVYDDPDRYRDAIGDVAAGRIDLFASGRTDTLLSQLQDDIFALRPLRETRETWAPIDAAEDTSVRFHIAHSPQREVEILHDQLLARFDADPSLRPRDIIVMVPDIDAYGPHIQAVFGLLAHDDPRRIPFTIADRGQRGQVPLLIAVEALLNLPDSRFAVSELLDLLDVPAVRLRAGIGEDDLPVLHRWIEGAGVRWGLDGAQRGRFGMPAALDQNSWRFGLQRMLLGYAVGNGAAVGGIEPYDEVGGLDAALAGKLAQFIDVLGAAQAVLSEATTPVEWAARLRTLTSQCLAAADDDDALQLDRLMQAADEWVEHCEQAELDLPLPLSVVREAWLSALNAGGLSQRFLSGAVNFCTLMPMRAIPFRLVCLMGMNEADYPRRQPRTDFDLIATDYRPGDRSRREDDRYLLLEALLSARDQLYVSWVGRSVQDNSPRPPSVLIGQLRDHIEAGWQSIEGDGEALLNALTQTHPLQPFSARYFTDGDGATDGWFTYAREWRQALAAEAATPDAVTPLADADTAQLSLGQLTDLLRDPAAAFLAQRLKVRFDRALPTSEDDELFVVDGLANWKLQSDLVERLQPWAETDEDGAALASRIDAEVARLRRQGRLPLAAFGGFAASALQAPLPGLLQRYRDALRAWPVEDPRSVTLRHAAPGGMPLLEDVLDGRRRNDAGEAARIVLVSNRLHEGRQYKWHVMLRPWVVHLAWQVAGEPLSTVLVSQSGDVVFEPIDRVVARTALDGLLTAWQVGMAQALPTACRTGFAWLEAGGRDGGESALSAAAQAYEDQHARQGEVGRSGALERVYPDFAALSANGEFPDWTERLYGPLWHAVRRHGKESA